MSSRFLLVALALPGLFLTSPAAGQEGADSGAFVVRLGTDTLAMERYVRSGNRIEGLAVNRSPRAVARRLLIELAADGSVVRMGVAPPEQELTARDNPQAGTIPLAGGFWLPWELAVRKAHAAAADSTVVNLLAGNTVRPTPIRRVGANTYQLSSQFDQPMEARVDTRGRLVSLTVAGGTTIERVASLDVEAWGREFAARDEAGTGLGPLSPRESPEATVHGARIALEYGRPSLRGRPLTMLVPVGEVWRTGANDASTVTTDRTLEFEGLTLTPGTYSIFVLPEPGRWTLIINRQTGMSGLDRDPAQDVGRVAMRTREDAPHTERFTITAGEENGRGALVLRWGGVEAVAEFLVTSS